MADNKILLIVVGAVLVIVGMNQGWFGGQASTPGTPPASGSGQNTDIGNIVASTIQTTVTFSSTDALSLGATAGSAHRYLSFNGLRNGIVTNGGTLTSAPGVAYKVLLGNATTSLDATVGKGYYPAYKEGVIGQTTADSVSGGQYAIDTAPSIVFTNSNGQVNTAQPLTTSDTKTVDIKLTAASKKCFGNKDAADKFAAKDVICFQGNATPVYSKIELAGATYVATPNSLTVASNFRAWCYELPVICDNSEYNGKVVITTGTAQPTSTGQENISISMHDVSYDYNTYTLDLIKGVQDEDGNDIGQADLGKTVYTYGGIAVS